MNEQTKPEKKNWVKPDLTVLVRHKPEEAVLDNCKTGTTPGPSYTHVGCHFVYVPCGDCQNMGQS
jgi:hypothetical protein